MKPQNGTQLRPQVWWMSFLWLINHIVNFTRSKHKLFHFTVWGYTSTFSATFTKGNKFCDFLFASLEDEVLSIGVKSLKKEFAIGANSFF